MKIVCLVGQSQTLGKPHGESEKKHFDKCRVVYAVNVPYTRGSLPDII